ncbi:MAG: PilT/PilU family type 4a pilus ATPase, partial [Victivallales bacterium]|nr:PilT/PilU family type 4a pilus ATPase [Victivallales bacterium]
MKKESLTNEIEWFCHHAVTERLLTKEVCVSVIEAIEANGLSVSLDLFVHVVLDNKICTDKARLDKLKTTSKDEARVFGAPARSVFAKSSPMTGIITQTPRTVPQPPPLPDPKVAETQPKYAAQEAKNDDSGSTSPLAAAFAKALDAAGASAQPSQSPAKAEEDVVAADVKASTSDWLTGWPNLAEAENLSPEGVRRLLNDFLHKAREMHCSDIHLSAGAKPFVRRYKQLFLLEEQAVLTPKASEVLNLSPLDEDQRLQFAEHRDLDYGYTISANDRYRTNIMLQRIGIAGSYRVVDTDIKRIRELGFKYPEVIEKLSTFGQGLILVTGPAGSGKSTTLTALVDHINRTRHDHIITVEDPIEVIHTPIGCNITQRELNKHTKSFGNALRAALREDPDVIVIGEMRDLETIEMAIHSSETGHLVIGTLHTSSAADTMNRILDVFPHGQQAQIRAMVAESLKGVICQQLLTNANGTGVVLASEVLLGTLAVSNLIREGKTYQLESTIQTN